MKLRENAALACIGRCAFFVCIPLIWINSWQRRLRLPRLDGYAHCSIEPGVISLWVAYVHVRAQWQFIWDGAYVVRCDWSRALAVGLGTR
jgi:hypothetical protein